MRLHPRKRLGGLPSNVKLLGTASLLNDVASEMIYPLMPQFLLGVLGGNRFHLGLIEGFAILVVANTCVWKPPPEGNAVKNFNPLNAERTWTRTGGSSCGNGFRRAEGPASCIAQPARAGYEHPPSRRAGL